MSLATFIEYDGSRGHFDGDVIPPYMMVPENVGGNNLARVFCVIDDVHLKSQNEHIAKVEHKYRGAFGEIYEIDGKSVSSTFIDMIDDNRGKTLGYRLQVDVKPERPLKVAFHTIIQDSRGAKSNRNPSVPVVLVPLMDEIFNHQCNTPVTSTVIEDIPIQTSLEEIIKESSIGRRPAWDRVRDACDPDAEFNIFFMPHATWTDVFDEQKIFIIPDPIPDDSVKVSLPHRMASDLGCVQVHKEYFKHYLMFHKRADGLGDIRPNGKAPFVGRNQIRAINPYGNHR